MSISFNKAKSLVRELVKKKEFPESEAVLYQKLLWAFVELGEAADAFKKGEDWKIIAEELIDTIFYIFDFFGLVEETQGLNFDLDDIFLKKWKKNMERPNQYGLRTDLNYSDGLLPYKLEKITFEINKKCLNKCRHCSAYVPGEDVEQILTFNDVRSIIDDFRKLGGKEINISGGEPLFHPDIYEIIKYGKNNGLIVNIFTCGVYSEDTKNMQLVDIVKNLLESKVDEVMITLHASYSNMHDAITGQDGSFEKTVQFISQLINIGQNVSIHFVPMQVNSEEVEELADFVSSLGISKLQILRFFAQGKGFENKAWLALTKENMAHLINEILKIETRNDVKVNLGHPGDFRFLKDTSYEPKPCSAGKLQCMVRVNGDIIPCPAFGDLHDWVAGNVFERDFEEIWRESPVFLRLREYDFRRLRGNCKGCEYLILCKGRCPAERIRENGDLYKGPDPICPKEIFVVR